MKRKYEIFDDRAYYDMWCVRDVSDKDFNSRASWHFVFEGDAKKLMELLNKAK